MPEVWLYRQEEPNQSSHFLLCFVWAPSARRSQRGPEYSGQGVCNHALCSGRMSGMEKPSAEADGSVTWLPLDSAQQHVAEKVPLMTAPLARGWFGRGKQSPRRPAISEIV